MGGLFHPITTFTVHSGSSWSPPRGWMHSLMRPCQRSLFSLKCYIIIPVEEVKVFMSWLIYLIFYTEKIYIITHWTDQRLTLSYRYFCSPDHTVCLQSYCVPDRCNTVVCHQAGHEKYIVGQIILSKVKVSCCHLVDIWIKWLMFDSNPNILGTVHLFTLNCHVLHAHRFGLFCTKLFPHFYISLGFKLQINKKKRYLIYKQNM